jgi:hypothetical protein
MTFMSDDVMPATLLEPGDQVLAMDGLYLGKVAGVFLDSDRLEVHFEGKPLPWVTDAGTTVRVPEQVHNG